MSGRCRNCGGDGYGIETQRIPCGGCAGTGRDMKEDLYAGYCRKCNGSKYEILKIRRTCMRCGGNGRDPYPGDYSGPTIRPPKR